MPIPAVIGAIGAGVSLAKGVADMSTSAGKLQAPGSQDAYRTWQDPSGKTLYDPDAYNYAPGESDEMLRQAIANQYRSAQLPDYAAANGYGAQAAGLGSASDLYRAAAMGNGYSAGQAQLQAGLAQQMAAQNSMTRSAGGGAYGMASAQSSAVQGAPLMQERGRMMAEMLRAQEQQQGMAGYAAASGDLRNRGLALADQYGQQAQQIARTQMDQRGRNDAMAQFYEGQRAGALGAQMAGAQQRNSDLAADNTFTAGLRHGVNTWNANQSERNFQNGMGTFASGASLTAEALNEWGKSKDDGKKVP